MDDAAHFVRRKEQSSERKALGKVLSIRVLDSNVFPGPPTGPGDSRAPGPARALGDAKNKTPALPGFSGGAQNKTPGPPCFSGGALNETPGPPCFSGGAQSQKTLGPKHSLNSDSSNNELSEYH